MAKYNDPIWIGKRFGMLTVEAAVSIKRPGKTSQYFWRVKCDCGNEKCYRPCDVISGKSVSCGCFRSDGKQAKRTHGQSRSRLHGIWEGMLSRCNPQNVHAERYGKRGISVCDEWHEYLSFSSWALRNGYEEGLTIERIDVNGNYCPENCKWIPLSAQARNRRSTFWVFYAGKEMSLSEAAEIAGLPYKQVHHRIKHLGWPVEDALSVPMKTGKSMLHAKCDELGLNYHTVYSRIRAGWSEADALGVPTLGIGANQTSYK